MLTSQTFVADNTVLMTCHYTANNCAEICYLLSRRMAGEPQAHSEVSLHALWNNPSVNFGPILSHTPCSPLTLPHWIAIGPNLEAWMNIRILCQLQLVQPDGHFARSDTASSILPTQVRRKSPSNYLTELSNVQRKQPIESCAILWMNILQHS